MITKVRRIRIVLCAGVSTLALVVAAPKGMAADLVKAPFLKAVAPQEPVVTMFLEGGVFWTGGTRSFSSLDGGLLEGSFDSAGDQLGIEGFRSQQRMGWSGAGGVDYQFAASPWHVSVAFRYGQAKSSSDLVTCGVRGAPGCFSSSAAATARAEHREQHWVADFMVGRDFGLGSGNAQLKAGIRVANLSSTSDSFAHFVYSSSTESFNQQIKREFLGVGPRIALDGSVPLSGAWAFDYDAGAAVLFGDRNYSASANIVSSFGVGGPFFLRNVQLTSSSAVFNADASAALAYWLTRRFKVAVGFRFDGYWDALIQQAETFNTESMNRFYFGPFIRATGKF
jgi:hypothetical protein